MQKQSLRLFRIVIVLASLLSVSTVGQAVAQQSSSAHYSVNETAFGAGASEHDCSTSYCAKTAVGDLVVGNGKSASYSAQFGSNTSNQPLLEVITSAGTSDMGVLDVTKTGTATASINVRNYLSAGYIIQLTGTSPSQGVHPLTTLSTPTTSHQGAEQFGVNVVANSSPAIGTNPLQVPTSAFSFGSAAPDYATANLFKYINGDIIAQSTTSSGETDYTLSMIINVSNVTPGGRYNGAFSAVVVPTF